MELDREQSLFLEQTEMVSSKLWVLSYDLALAVVRAREEVHAGAAVHVRKLVRARAVVRVGGHQQLVRAGEREGEGEEEGEGTAGNDDDMRNHQQENWEEMKRVCSKLGMAGN